MPVAVTTPVAIATDVAVAMHVVDTMSDTFLKKLKVCIYAMIIVASHEVIDTERLYSTAWTTWNHATKSLVCDKNKLYK